MKSIATIVLCAVSMSCVVFAQTPNGLPKSVPAHRQREIPIVVEAQPVSGPLKSGEPLLLRVSIRNGHSRDIHFSTFSLTPNSWHGETINISLVDIYKTPDQMGRFLARPRISETPKFVAGVAGYAIKPGESLSIVIDMAKWQIRNGWTPGKYKITVLAENIAVDNYTSMSVMSDPTEIEIQ